MRKRAVNAFQNSADQEAQHLQRLRQFRCPNILKSFRRQETARTVLKPKRCQPVAEECACVDADAVGVHFGRVLRRVSMHHDLAEILLGAKKLVADGTAFLYL